MGCVSANFTILLSGMPIFEDNLDKTRYPKKKGGSWNNYLLPLFTINNSKWFTLPLFVSTLGIGHRTDYGARMAALCMATIPVLLIFLTRCGVATKVESTDRRRGLSMKPDKPNKTWSILG
ncbi:hypothetical protein M0651_23550 [Paenibacillus sp. MBLB2552]|uniref:Uncharacterized protein n=1 Tax=Paenibacillus mellifer TaxID=2937794 RepID=A0A9X2BS34_9BACL|nr:hypothetical protein [Paenibacillus mellifer]MCK8490143.1 hypothetical protein [Paenibacillus mellifer]